MRRSFECGAGQLESALIALSRIQELNNIRALWLDAEILLRGIGENRNSDIAVIAVVKF